MATYTHKHGHTIPLHLDIATFLRYTWPYLLSGAKTGD